MKFKAGSLFTIPDVVTFKNRTAFFTSILSLSTLRHPVSDKLPKPAENMDLQSTKVETIHLPTFVLSSPGCVVRRRLLIYS